MGAEEINTVKKITKYFVQEPGERCYEGISETSKNPPMAGSSVQKCHIFILKDSP